MKNFYLFLIFLVTLGIGENTWGAEALKKPIKDKTSIESKKINSFNQIDQNNIHFEPDKHIQQYDIEEHFIHYCDNSYAIHFKNVDLDKLDWENVTKEKDYWWIKSYLRCLEDASYISPETNKFIRDSDQIYMSKETPEIIVGRLNELVLKTRAENKIDDLLEYELTKVEINSYKTIEEVEKAKENLFKLAFTRLFKLKKVEPEIDHYIMVNYGRTNIDLQINSMGIFYRLNSLAEEIDKYLAYRKTLPEYYESIFFGTRYSFFSLAQFYLNKNNPYFNLEKAKKYLELAKQAENEHKKTEIRPKEYNSMIKKTFNLFDEIILEYQGNNNVWADYLYKKLTVYGY